MRTTEINAILALRNFDLSDVAKKIGENRSFLSQVIGYHSLRNQQTKSVRRARLKFSMFLGMRIEEVFDGAEPATTDEINITLKELNRLGYVVIAMSTH